MAKSEVQFRIDQYREIDELLERVRQAHGEPVQPVEPRDVDYVPSNGPAHRVDGERQVREQWNRNLATSQLVDPQAYSRDGRPPVPKVFESPDGDLPARDQGLSVNLRRQAQTRRPDQTAAVYPSWLTQGVTGTIVDDAARNLEDRRNQFMNAPTRVAGGNGETGQPAAPAEQQYYDAAAAAEASQQQLIATYAKDVEVVAGRGAEVPVKAWPVDAQVTKTDIVAKKR